MSYLQILQEQLRRPTVVEQMISGAGKAFGGYAAAQIANAREQAKIIQQQGESAAKQNEWSAAARAANQLSKALQTGYGINPVIAPIVGSPIVAPTISEAQRPSPSFVGPMPGVVTGSKEVGRSFESPQTQSAIRAGLMIQPTAPIKVGDAVYYPDEKKFVNGPADPTKTQYSWVRPAPNAPEQYLPVSPGMTRYSAPHVGGGGERAPRLIPVYDPSTNTMVVAPMTPGLRMPLPPARITEVNPDGTVTPVVVPYDPRPQGKPVKGKKPAAKPAPLSVVSDPSKLKSINDLAMKEYMRTTPGASSETAANAMIQSNPDELKKFSQIKTRLIIEADLARGITTTPPTQDASSESALDRALRMMDEEKLRKGKGVQ